MLWRRESKEKYLKCFCNLQKISSYAAFPQKSLFLKNGRIYYFMERLHYLVDTFHFLSDILFIFYLDGQKSEISTFYNIS
jgi:hypothetical protein